jgi:DNA-binding response OmpR family regulator
MSNFIDVHMKNLRKKISAKGRPQLVKTVRGFGYRLDMDEK